MNNIERKALEKFIGDIEREPNCRYASWEHCHRIFKKVHEEKSLNENMDLLCLNLYVYLASWGMLRGSFLLRKDYTIQSRIINILFKEEYDYLWDIDFKNINDELYYNLVLNLKKEIGNEYRKIRKEVKGNIKTDITDTLISKVMLGTIGCVPAYDRFFKDKKSNVKTYAFNKESLKSLVKYYLDNYEELEKYRKRISTSSNIEYTQMKIIDMIFWQMGFDKDKEKIEK